MIGSANSYFKCGGAFAATALIAVAVSGCGGGGGSGPETGATMPPGDGDGMLPDVAQQQLQAAIERAQDAEIAAFSSAARASIRCDAVPAACAAARTAADQAFLAEDARIAAEESTTVARAERAAAAAELAARNAEIAAAEADRNAEAEPSEPQQPPVAELPDWILPGTVDSQQARNVADNELDFTRYDADWSYDLIEYLDPSEQHLWSTGPELSYVSIFSRPNRADGEWSISATEWGFWSHPTMSSDITKLQHTLAATDHFPQCNPQYATCTIPWTHRSIFGVLSDAIFGLVHQTRYSYITEKTGHFVGPFFEYDSSGAFANDDDSYQWAPRAEGGFEWIPRHSDLFFVGARWEGDAFAVSTGTLTPVHGPASLAITKFYSTGHAFGGEYDFMFEAQFNDGGNVQFNDLFGYSGPNIYDVEGRSIHTGTSTDTGAFTGKLMGPRADEVVGGFVTEQYHGAFGLRRQ